MLKKISYGQHAASEYSISSSYLELNSKVSNTRRLRVPLLCLSVHLSVTPAFSGVSRADKQQTLCSVPRILYIFNL